MLFADRPGVINSTGICVDRAGIAWDRRGGEVDDEREAAPVEVFGPCGGAALYRRAMLDEIGLFDEDFFAYLEDVDLAWRARRAGVALSVRACGAGAAPSFGNRSGGLAVQKLSPGPQQGLVDRQELPVRPAVAVCATVWFLYDVVAVVYALIVRRDVHAFRGRLAGLAGLRRMWRKRGRSDTIHRGDLVLLAPCERPWRVRGRYAHLASPSQPGAGKG